MRVDTWVARIVKGTSFAAALALIAMMLTTVADVAMATLFKRPIIGAYDMVEAMLVFSVFLGIPATFLRNGNIVVDVVDFFVAKGTVHRLKQLAKFLTLVFLVLLLWSMITPALDAYQVRGKEAGARAAPLGAVAPDTVGSIDVRDCGPRGPEQWIASR